MTNDVGWVLLELIDGPRHGTLLEIEAMELGQVLGELTEPTSEAVGSYVESSLTAGAGSDSLQFVDGERRAIARHGRGSPELYLPLTWMDSTDAPGKGWSARTGDQLAGGGPADLLTALLAGHEAEALAIARRTEDLGSGSIEMLDAILAPAMRSIGQRWQDGNMSIYVEHRATEIARRIVADQIRPVRRGRRGRAITAVLTGDPHVLPTEMAAEALDDDGWTVDRLGVNTPPEVLINEVDPDAVDLVVLSPTMASNQAVSQVTASRLRERGIVVIVGEPGRSLADLRQQARAAVA